MGLCRNTSNSWVQGVVACDGLQGYSRFKIFGAKMPTYVRFRVEYYNVGVFNFEGFTRLWLSWVG